MLTYVGVETQSLSIESCGAVKQLYFITFARVTEKMYCCAEQK